MLSGILKHKWGPKRLDLPASQPGNGIHTFLIIAFSLRSQLREIVSNDTPIECVTEHLNWINLLQKENQFSKVHLFTYSAAAVHRCPLKSSTHNVTFFFCLLHNASISWGLFTAFSNYFQQSWWVSHIEVKYTNVCALFNTTSPILLLLLFRNLNLFPFRQFYWPLTGLYACFMMLHLCPFCLPTESLQMTAQNKHASMQSSENPT